MAGHASICIWCARNRLDHWGEACCSMCKKLFHIQGGCTASRVKLTWGRTALPAAPGASPRRPQAACTRRTGLHPRGTRSGPSSDMCHSLQRLARLSLHVWHRWSLERSARGWDGCGARCTAMPVASGDRSPVHHAVIGMQYSAITCCWTCKAANLGKHRTWVPVPACRMRSYSDAIKLGHDAFTR